MCVFITAVPITKLFARGGAYVRCVLLLQNLFQSCVLGSVLENEFGDPNRFSVNDGVLYREQKMDCIEYRNGQFRVQKMDFSFRTGGSSIKTNYKGHSPDPPTLVVKWMETLSRDVTWLRSDAFRVSTILGILVRT